MSYLIILILLIILSLVYFKVADRYNIIDKPNQRSSHRNITIRGGGIIFPLAVVLAAIFFNLERPWFIGGLFLISTISFLDDVWTLSASKRIPVQLLSVILLLLELDFGGLTWYWWLVGVILIMGWINAFNFMDGINGITAFYAIVSIITFYYLNLEYPLINEGFILVVFLSLLVFSFFNARKSARTFAGDVGSVSMAFILAFLMLRLILLRGHWEYVLLFSIYGIDTVITILQRLRKRENIFQAHRTHLYQYLANELKISQLYISIVYALFQLLLNVVIIYLIELEYLSSPALFLLVLIPLVVLYIGIKWKVLKTIKV